MTNGPEAEAPFPRPLSREPVRRLPAAQVPARTVIEGGYVRLEPLDAEQHGLDLYSTSHENPEALKIWEYLPVGPYPSQTAFVEALRQQTARLEQVYFAVRAKHDGELTRMAEGQTSYLDIQPHEGVIEIGSIWFGLDLRQTRAATEALYLMLRTAMDDLRYRRMQWRCNSLNIASRGAAKRLGFRFEGIFYNHMITKGLNRDTAWYSILDDEWPEVRSILEGWLNPSNFDEVGRAKSSLTDLMRHRSPSTRRA
jgi:RimJ/RimL family protein N-acetyltransferase